MLLREKHSFADKVIAAIRRECGGHVLSSSDEKKQA